MTKDELKTLSDQTFTDNDDGDITPAAHRDFNNELIEVIPEQHSWLDRYEPVVGEFRATFSSLAVGQTGSVVNTGSDSIIASGSVNSADKFKSTGHSAAITGGSAAAGWDGHIILSLAVMPRFSAFAWCGMTNFSGANRSPSSIMMWASGTYRDEDGYQIRIEFRKWIPGTAMPLQLDFNVSFWRVLKI